MGPGSSMNRACETRVAMYCVRAKAPGVSPVRAMTSVGILISGNTSRGSSSARTLRPATTAFGVAMARWGGIPLQECFIPSLASGCRRGEPAPAPSFIDGLAAVGNLFRRCAFGVVGAGDPARVRVDEN